MPPKVRTADAEIAEIATRAHGVVTRRDLLIAGLSVAEIRHRLEAGALIPVHRGVYRVGHTAPSTEARYLAAVRACGDGALICGRAAGHLIAILRIPPPSPEVLAPRERRVPGVRTRRWCVVDRSDAMTWMGIPVTTPARTLVDLAAILTENALARASHEAGIKHSTTPDQIEAVLARRSNSPGARKLRQVIHGEIPVTLSVLEARFIGCLREAGLPLPETNELVGGRRVDCRWPGRRLTVELDGYRYHRSRLAWEQDRQREREARRRGDEFRRYTYTDVLERPHQMLHELRELLSHAGNDPA